MLGKLKNSKFCSRKFLLALLGDIIGIVTIVADNGEGDVQAVAAIILIILSTVSYIIGESKIDAVGAAKKVITSAEEVEKLVHEILTNDDNLISAKENKDNKETTTKEGI